MENFINTLKIDWYYTQKAIEMLQGKWYWTAAILIVIACAIYVAVKKPLLLPLIAWGPFTSVVINNAIYLKLLKHMEELEYTQCTAFALVVGMIVGAGFIASAVDMRKPYRFGLKGLLAMPPLEIIILFAIILIVGIGDAFSREPVAMILALALVFGLGSGVTGVIVILL